MLDEEKLLPLISPLLTTAKLNMPGLQKLQKAKQLVPFGIDIHLESMGLFLYFLTEKLNAKEKAALAKGIGLSKREIELWQKLEVNAKKLEKDLKSAKLQKPSHVYSAAFEIAGRSVPVPAGALFRAHGARPHPELSAEVSAQRAGSHRERCAGHGRETWYAEIPEGARRIDSDQAGCASQESAAARSATTAYGRRAWEAHGSRARDGAQVTRLIGKWRLC